MKQLNLGSGIFPDIAADIGRLLIACVANGQVLVRSYTPDGSSTVMYSATCGGTGFARIRVIVGHPVLTYRTGDGLSIAVRDLTTGEEIRHTGTFYNWPMVLGDSQYAIDDLSPGREQVRVYAYIGELEATNPPAPGTGF